MPPAGGTLHRLSNHRCPIHRKKYGGAMCRRRAAHCTDFSNHRCPIIHARSAMPNPLEKIWRCNVTQGGGTLHRLFQSSMPDHRCPIHRKKIWRCNVPHRCPIIDARSSMPNTLEKKRRCNVPPPGGTLHRLCHSSERPLIGNAIAFPIDRNSQERHCIPNGSE